jgi:hypothetical protein
MALPLDNSTAKVIAVQEAIKKMSPQELSTLPGLERGDFAAFGMLMQHFCFIDLNLRRALELFAISKMLPKSVAKRYPDLSDSMLRETLIEIVKGMDVEAEDIPMALSWLEDFSKARGYRNLVGHFAGKRFPMKTFTCSPVRTIGTRGRSWATVLQLIAYTRLLRGDPSS